MLTSKQRAALRKAANGLTPVFQVGKDGVDTPLVTATADCLAARELIKLRVLKTSPQPARDVADELSGQTGAETIAVVGFTLVLFKKKDKDSRFAEVL